VIALTAPPKDGSVLFFLESLSRLDASWRKGQRDSGGTREMGWLALDDDWWRLSLVRANTGADVDPSLDSILRIDDPLAVGLVDGGALFQPVRDVGVGIGTYLLPGIGRIPGADILAIDDHDIASGIHQPGTARADHRKRESQRCQER
jgi:hypothetical protein